MGYREVVLDSGPFAYWRLGEASGTTAAEEMGNHPGTYEGGVTLGVTGVTPPDTAIEVVAPGVVTVADSAALQAAHPGLTVETWLRQDTLPADWTYAVHRNENWAIGSSVYALGYNPSGYLVWSIGGNYTAGTTSTTMADGRWHHVVGTWDGATARLYLDGRLIHSYAQATLGNKPATTTLGGHAFEATNPGRGFVGGLDEVALYSRVLTQPEITEHFRSVVGVDNNILDYSTWEVGEGSAPGFAALGSATENHRILDSDPTGRSTVVWEARPDDVSGPDGGWNGDQFPIDPTKTYRFSVWIRRTVIGNGSAYLGTRGYGATDGVAFRDTGAVSTNPYFWSGAWPHPVNDWVLIVAHVWPAGSGTGENKPDSGMYAADGTYLGAIHRDMVWSADTATSVHRSYLFYSTDITTRQQFLYPRVEVVDGTEPSVADLISNPANFGFILPASSYPEAVLRDEPVGYWRLGEKSGTTALDSSGNGHDGAYGGSPELGQRGALHLDADTAVNFVAAGDNISALNPKADPSQGSVEAWVHTRTWDDLNRHGIFQNVPTWSNGANRISLFRYSHGTNPDSAVFYFRIVAPDGTLQDRATAWGNWFQKDAWNHVVGTWDATTMRLYINGIEVSSRAIVPPSAFPSSEVRWASGHNGDLLGRGDEFALYDYALSPQQVKDHYGARSLYRQAVMGGFPVGYWRLDRPGDAVDEVGTSNGVLSGVVTPDQLGPREDVRAVEFGGGSYTVPTAPHLEVTGSQSIEMWLRPNLTTLRANPFNKAYGGEGTITQEGDTRGNALNYYYGTAGANASPYQGFNSGTDSLTHGEWHHVALVRDLEAMTLTWYINGVQTTRASAAYAEATASLADIIIGSGYAGAYTGGRIAEVALYDYALRPEQVRDHLRIGLRQFGPHHVFKEESLHWATTGDTTILRNGIPVGGARDGEGDTFLVSPGDAITFTRLPGMRTDSDAVPGAGWAGRQFAWASTRYLPHTLYLLSPWDNAEALYRLGADDWDEDFEGGTHRLDGGSPNFATSTDSPRSGTTRLDYTGGIAHALRLDTSALRPAGPEFVYEGWVRLGALGTHLAGLTFGATGTTTEGYQVFIDGRNSTGSAAAFQIRVNTSTVILASDNNLAVEGQRWYRIQVEWPAAGSITARLYDDRGVLLSTLTSTDATYSTGYIGVHGYDAASYDDLAIGKRILLHRGVVEQVSLTATGSNYLTADHDILAYVEGTPGDRILLVPASTENLAWRLQNLLSFGAAPTPVANLYAHGPDPFTITSIADGAGGDAEQGVPRHLVRSNYAVDHSIDGYIVVAVEPTVVTVESWDGAVWQTYATHDLSAASTSNPLTANVGTVSGAGAIIVTGPVRWRGTGPFYVRTNDPAQDEYHLVGWDEVTPVEVAPAPSGLVRPLVSPVFSYRDNALLGRVAEDSAPAEDSATRSTFLKRTGSDTSSVSDVASRTTVARRSTSDSAPVSETVTRRTTHPRGGDEVVGGSDVATRQPSFFRSTSDSVPTGDAATRYVSRSRSASDLTVVDDEATRKTTHPRTVGDSAPVVDDGTREPITFARSGEDTLTTSDAAVRSDGTFTRTSNDGAPASEAGTRNTSYFRSAGDGAPVVEAPAHLATLHRAANEWLHVTQPPRRTLVRPLVQPVFSEARPMDVAVKSVFISRTVTDSAPVGSDTATRSVTYARSAVDSVPVSDAADRGGSWARSVTDSAPASDGVVSSATQPRTAADVLPAVADGTSHQALLQRGAGDDVPVTDEAARTTVHPRTTGDSAPVTDSADRLATRERTAVDVVSADDAATRYVARSRGVADTAPAADEVASSALLRRSADDALAPVTDALSEEVHRGRMGTDAAPATDEVTRSFTGSRATDDSAPAVDAVQRVAPKERTTSDIAPASDAVERSAGVFTRTVGDDAPATDDGTRAPITFHRSGSETLTTSDAASRSEGVFSRATSDEAPSADAVERLVLATKTADDAAPADDGIERWVGYARQVADEVPVADAATRYAARQRSASDSAPASDGVGRAGSFARTPSDLALVADAATRSILLLRTVGDTAPVGDALDHQASHLRDVGDLAPAGDVSTHQVLLFRSPADAAPVSDEADRNLSTERYASDYAPAADAVTSPVLAPRTGTEVLPPVIDGATITTWQVRLAPKVTITSVSRTKVSHEDDTGFSVVTFSFDQPVTAWVVRVGSTSHLDGTLAHQWSGDPTLYGLATVTSSALQPGDNRVTIYGRSLGGVWSR